MRMEEIRLLSTHAFRLRRGADLKKSIVEYAKDHRISAAVILSCVGCLSEGRLRCADGETIVHLREPMEIVSCMGTVSASGSHLHISLSREDLSTIGGHLVEGCLVNTTAEIVLMELPYRFNREFDPGTGYDELIITPPSPQQEFPT